MALTIAGAADALLRYPVTYAKDIAAAMRLDNEWMADNISSQRATDHTYVAPTAVLTDVIQAYQCQFTPKGGVTLDQVANTLDQLKVDISITCDDINKFYASWLSDWYEIGKDPKVWSFAKYLWTKLILPKVNEELNWNYYWGVKAAPTPGVAGSSVASMTGLSKKLDDYVTAGKLVPITTGAITTSNVVDRVETFVAALPPAQKRRPGAILVSQTIYEWYYKNYRLNFGTGNGVAGNDNIGAKIDGTNKWLQPMTSMEGSQKLIWAPDLIVGKRIGEADLPVPEVETSIRELKLSMVFHRFIGIEYFFNTFVNDQA